MEIIKPGTNIDFLGKRRLFGIISIAAVILSLGLIIVVGPNYGIDFKGGTNIIVRFHEPESAQDVTRAMAGLGFADAVVQTFGADDENQFLIQTNRISTITQAQANTVRDALVAEFGEEDFDFNYNVDSGDRIEVRVPEGAFDDLPPDWQPPTASEGTGSGAREATPEGTGAGFAEALMEWSDWDNWDDPEKVAEFRADAEAMGFDLDDPAQVARLRRQAQTMGLTAVTSFLDSLEGDGADGADEVAPIMSAQRRYMQHLLTEAGLENPRVSTVGNPRQNRFLIRLQQIQGRVEEGLRAEFGAAFAQVDRVETVGPRVGEQLRNDGIKAVILALFFILVYIGLRFNMRFAPGAVVALFHDVMITMGILVIIREEVTLTILAALLTIVGYSLNDTIVVFDRIRENFGALRTKELPTIVNQSINECLSRTLLTSVTTLLAVAAIYFLGGGLIKSFALAMIIGIVVGTYSSIYVASPVMIWLHDRLEARTAREREASRSSRRPSKARRPS